MEARVCRGSERAYTSWDEAAWDEADGVVSGA